MSLKPSPWLAKSTIKMFFDSFDSSSSLRTFACVDQLPPWFRFFLMNFLSLFRNRKLRRHMKKIIRKVFFDQVSLVATAYYEIMNTMGGVCFHDMPKNGFPSYFDQGLWFQVRLLTDSGAKPPCQNNGFHNIILLLQREKIGG